LTGQVGHGGDEDGCDLHVPLLAWVFFVEGGWGEGGEKSKHWEGDAAPFMLKEAYAQVAFSI
jgi:hypothetical protein